MENGCKDCVYVTNLKQGVDELKSDVKDVDRRVVEMEVGAGETKEQVKTIFNMLTKIEKSVDEIKNSKNKFITGVISGVSIAIITTFIIQAVKIFHW